MDVVSILQKMREPLEGFPAEVRGDGAGEHPKRFVSLAIVYRLRGKLDCAEGAAGHRSVGEPVLLRRGDSPPGAQGVGAGVHVVIELLADRSSEGPVTVDDAVRDLLSISTDISGVAVLDAEGRVLATSPPAATDSLVFCANRLWAAACSTDAAREGAVADVVVHDGRGVVAMLEASGHRIIATTGPRPAVGLLLFDLRACLADAFDEGGEAS